MLVLNQRFNRLTKGGRTIGLYRFSDCFVGKFDFALGPLGAGPGFFFGGTAKLPSVVRPAEVFPAVAAFIEFVAGMLATEREWRTKMVMMGALKRFSGAPEDSAGLVRSQSQN